VSDPSPQGLRTTLPPWPTPTEMVTCDGGVSIQFNAYGAVSSSVTPSGTWADSEHTLGLFSYSTHSEEEFFGFTRNYLRPPCGGECGGCGFSKCGLSTNDNATSSRTLPKMRAAYANMTSCQFFFDLQLHSDLQSMYGAPSSLTLAVNVTSTPSITYDLHWEKRATRMAESLYGSPSSPSHRKAAAPDWTNLDVSWTPLTSP